MNYLENSFKRDRSGFALALGLALCGACSQPTSSERKPVNTACPQAEVEARAECLSALAVRKNDVDACAAVELPKVHDECVQQVAVAASNFELCASASVPLRRDKCRKDVAAKKPSAAACAAIGAPFLREACYVNLAGTDAAPNEPCSLVQAEKYACFSRAAERDPKQCERIGTSPASFVRRRCYEKVIEHGSALSTEICQGMSDPLAQQQCLAKVALLSHDSSRCAQLSLPEVADDCWVSFADHDANACVQVKQTDRRRQCASQHWVDATDSKVCVTLVPEALRAACVKHVAQNATKKPH